MGIFCPLVDILLEYIRYMFSCFNEGLNLINGKFESALIILNIVSIGRFILKGGTTSILKFLTPCSNFTNFGEGVALILIRYKSSIILNDCKVDEDNCCLVFLINVFFSFSNFLKVSIFSLNKKGKYILDV